MSKIADKFNKVPEKKIKPETEEKKTTKNKLLKVIAYLQKNYDFRYNEITTETDWKRKDQSEYKFFDDVAYRSILLELQLKGLSISELNYKNIIYGNHVSENYNPFKDYFFNLPKWDGKTDHIQIFCQQVQLEDESMRKYFVEAFKRWLVATVVGLTNDLPDQRKVNQTILVFYGTQGKFKTTFLNNLVPKQFQLKYLYTGNFHSINKDHQLMLGTKWLINLDEMATLNRNDVESIKSAATTPLITLRKAYGKAEISLKRRSAFCGSINRKEFLTDMTGNRRFLAFSVENIDLNDYDIDLVYSQAFALMKQNFKYWFDRDDIQIIENANEEYRLRSMEEELIISHYEPPSKKEVELDININYRTATDIANELANEYSKINVNNTVVKQIGMALRSHGFEQKKRRATESGQSMRMWMVKYKNKVLSSMNNQPPANTPF